MQQSWRFWIIPVLVVVLIFVMSSQGIGISPDSISYISAARNLWAGEGFIRATTTGGYEFMSHFPPVFPLLLLVTGVAWNVAGGVVLNAIFAAASIYLTAKIATHYTTNKWLVLLSQVLVGVSASFLYVHVHLWSEPMFIAFSLLLISLAVENYHAHKTKLAILVALLPLIRYAGLLFVLIAWCVHVVEGMMQKQPLRELVKRGAQGSLLVVPFLSWTIVGSIQGEQAREVGFHLVSIDQIRQGVSVMWGWLFPTDFGLSYGIRAVILLLVAAFLAVLLFYQQRKSSPQRGVTLSSDLVFLLIPLYVLFISATITFLDSATKMNQRMLAPVVPILMILLVRSASIVKNQIVTICIICLVLVSVGWGGVRYLIATTQNGAENANSWWRNSEALTYICHQPKETIIVSNAREAAYLYCQERNLVDLNSFAAWKNAHQSGLSEVQVIFVSGHERFPAELTEEQRTWRVEKQFTDGIMYRVE